MARNKLATKAIVNGSLVVSFADGHKLECDPARLSDEIKAQLILHGLSQKVGDSFAGAESIAEAIANAESTWESLLKGNWATRTRGGILAEAVAILTGRDIGEVIEMLDELDDKQRNGLRKDPAVAAKILELQQARIKGESKLDLNGLFAK